MGGWWLRKKNEINVILKLNFEFSVIMQHLKRSPGSPLELCALGPKVYVSGV